MPRLIVLNGPPGSGKSTLARRYIDEHPLALNLDIDRVRSLLGRWRDQPTAAGGLARAIALAAARTHLAAGHDVVIPQYLGRTAFIEQTERVAAAAGARFDEVVLIDERERALRRFLGRPARGAAVEPHAEQDVEHARTTTPAEFLEMYDRLLDVIAARPGASVVRTAEGRIDQAYRDFLARLG